MSKIQYSPGLDRKFKNIARKISLDRIDTEDLAQQCWLHLIENKDKLYDKTESYILKSCLFHLKHFVDKGKSIDVKKREGISIASLNGNLKSRKESVEFLRDNLSLERKIIEILLIDEIKDASFLSPKEINILNMLFQGDSQNDIHEKLGVSKQQISKYTKRILSKIRKFLGNS